MRELLNRFSIDAIKINGQTITCALVIWVAVLGCALASINSQPFNQRQRLFWIVFVLCVPLVGLLCYLPCCVIYATSDSSQSARKK